MKTKTLFLFSVPFLAQAQPPIKVTKTNPKPVYAHYMPWFDTPQTSGNGQWGWHWKMDKMDPNMVDGTGKRQIASHYYPLTGPYASSDPDVIQYHLLLMKLSGIDGILLDWYGSQGTNGDVQNLLRNSDTIVNRTVEAAMMFGLVIEDRFWSSTGSGTASMTYAKDHYFNKSTCFRFGAGNDPVVGVFGPVTFQNGSDWTTILSGAGEDVLFLPLEYQGNEGGSNTDGEYAWPYQSQGTTDHYTQVDNFYKSRVPQLQTAMGLVYPGFHDFYAQGQNGGSSYFYIPSDNGKTLDTMISLFNTHTANLDIMQIATWNDYGEGTVIEPTREDGYSYLMKIQKYTGVTYTECDLKQVYKYYSLRKLHASNSSIIQQLNQVFKYFAALQITNAVNLMNTIDPADPCAVTGVSEIAEESVSVFPNPVSSKLYVHGIDMQNSSLRISDITGRELQVEYDRVNFSLDVLGLDGGIYFLEITTATGRVIRKFMVQ